MSAAVVEGAGAPEGDAQGSELADAVARWTARDWGRARRTACAQGDAAAAAEVWAELAALGLLSLRVPERADGIDATLAETTAVVEVLGRAAMTEPVVPVAVTAAAVLRAARDDAALTALAEGRTRPVLAWTEPGRGWDEAPGASVDGAGRLTGAKAAVAGAAAADVLIVSARDAGGAPVLVRVRAQDAGRRAWRGWDGTDGAELTFDAAPAEILLSGAQAASALAEALDLTRLALAAEATGLSARALELTLEHIRTREQFGRPLAANQALRHRLSEAWVELELARAIVTRAAREIDAGADAARRARISAAAKLQAGEAGRLIGEEAVQMHGGIGITEDAEVSALYRRLVAIDLAFGASAGAVARFRAAGRA